MKSRRGSLITFLGLPVLLAAASSGDKSYPLTLTWEDSGTFFEFSETKDTSEMRWGDDRIHSGPDHCRSLSSLSPSWEEKCLRNARVLDALDIRLGLSNADWAALESQARNRSREIEDCLHGRPVDVAPPNCYGDGKSNAVTQEAFDQYGGRWTLTAGLGYPSEGRFDAPLWVHANLQHLGPLRVRVDATGLLAVEPPASRHALEVERVRQATDRGLENLER